MSHSHAIAWILLIWTLSSALAMPNAFYSVVVEDRLVNENLASTCTMIWPDGRYPLSSYDHIYNIVILVVTYLVPIITMAILYYKVGKELWGYETIGENIEKQQRAILAKKKIVKMMIVVVIIFALCWLPYHAFFVVNYYLPTIFQDGPLFYQRCYLLMYWLAMSNSMYNPIIIYFMNSKHYVPPIKIDNNIGQYQPQQNINNNLIRANANNLSNSNLAAETNHNRCNNSDNTHFERLVAASSDDCLNDHDKPSVNHHVNKGKSDPIKSLATLETVGNIEVIITHSHDNNNQATTLLGKACNNESRFNQHRNSRDETRSLEKEPFLIRKTSPRKGSSTTHDDKLNESSFSANSPNSDTNMELTKVWI